MRGECENNIRILIRYGELNKVGKARYKTPRVARAFSRA